ncbi:hypothetical protein I5M27_03135 [Adhaeribacter sp. BT258]|uniref:DUF5723 domain-containing protein n=1 Tax=Adhaeribacter terrigena TaxID=2793070 RepID=A0ABS1BYH9_9BACT|nr:DUF5723 family protein [Adhaeribacter terrigena]MBK0401962.1 hypothetical protein [Adhaeribacter terrigena]
MKRIAFAGLLAILFTGNARAQNELSNFTATGRGGVVNTFATDYQAIGINPANLGRTGNAPFAFSIGEIGAGVRSESLTHEQLNKFIFHSEEKLDSLQKQAFARAFNHEDAFNLNFDIATLSVSAYFEKIGGFAFSNRIRVTGHMGLNKNASEILFLGQNAPVFQHYQIGDTIGIRKTLNPTFVKMQILNEWNLAYGAELVRLPGFKLQAGLGYKFMQGVGVIEIAVDGENVTAYTALSPKFNVNYGALVNDPNFNTTDIGEGFFKPVGKGHGFDLGIAAEIGQKLKASLSVTDVGSIKWRGNLLTANDQYIQKTSSDGIESFDFLDEVIDLAGTGSSNLFIFTPESELKRKLPAKLRTGVGVRLSDKLETGLDATFPLNDVAGNLEDPFAGVGVDFKALPYLKLSSGFSAGAGYGASIPLGFTFETSGYAFGVATRDVVGLFSTQDPYLSVAFGFLRFKFSTDESP